MADADRLTALLDAVRHGEDSGQPMSSALLVEHLGWTAADVAEWLGTARSRLLIWGLRCSGDPSPQFDELELTVQGRRLLEVGPHGRAGDAPLLVAPPADSPTPGG
jgi:hypothetical protein